MPQTDADPSPTGGRVRTAAQRLRRLKVVPALVGLAIVLGGCKVPTFGAFRGATTQGQQEFKLWTLLVIMGIVVAVIVWLLIFWAVFRYRRRDDSIPKQVHEHLVIEIIYTVIPVVLVGVIFYATYFAENKIDTVVRKPAEIVHVLAYRWGWRFTYDSGAGTSQHVVVQTAAQPEAVARPAVSSQYPQLVIPSHSTVRIVLQSADVIHGFYIPAFNFSRYAQPGWTNVFDFTTLGTGTYPARCSQYCGLYHAEMLFSVKVVQPSTFANWLHHKQA